MIGFLLTWVLCYRKGTSWLDWTCADEVGGPGRWCGHTQRAALRPAAVGVADCHGGRPGGSRGADGEDGAGRGDFRGRCGQAGDQGGGDGAAEGAA